MRLNSFFNKDRSNPKKSSKSFVLSNDAKEQKLQAKIDALQTEVNKFRKNRYKQAVKKIQKLIEKKDVKEINKYFPTFQAELMKVAKSGVVKKKNLSRKISKISKKIKRITK